MIKQRRVVAVHDISCFGKCSLTVALPIISSAGIEASVIPTSVLSTHTGGFTGFTFRDLTDDIPEISKHWKDIDLKFDAIYTGYLGSQKQIDIVKRFIDDFRNDGTIAVIDPAMADHGKLYTGFSQDFPSLMAGLCAKADVVVPNITEAAMMLGTEYKEGPYTEEYIEKLLRGLYDLGAKSVVLTGVYFDSEKLGAACFDGESIQYVFDERIGRLFHGTGDVFASALVSALMCGRDLKQATQVAVKFTCIAIAKTMENNPEREYGVNFEQAIPALIKMLEL